MDYSVSTDPTKYGASCPQEVPFRWLTQCSSLSLDVSLTCPSASARLQTFVCSTILLSSYLLNPKHPPKMTFDLPTLLLRYPIPSIIYVLLNNIHFSALLFLDAPSFQLLSNLKIVTTAILFRWALCGSQYHLVRPPDQAAMLCGHTLCHTVSHH